MVYAVKVYSQGKQMGKALFVNVPCVAEAFERVERDLGLESTRLIPNLDGKLVLAGHACEMIAERMPYALAA